MGMGWSFINMTVPFCWLCPALSIPCSRIVSAAPGSDCPRHSAGGRARRPRPRARHSPPRRRARPEPGAGCGLRTRKLLLSPSTVIAAMIPFPSQTYGPKKKPRRAAGRGFGLSACRSELPHAENPRPAGHGRTGFDNHRIEDLAHGLKARRGRPACQNRCRRAAKGRPTSAAAITRAKAAVSDGARKLPVK
jgi:hypothetical protein